MKPFDFTIDNYLRHPLRWGRFPIDKHEPLRKYGVQYKKQHVVGQFAVQWVFILNYGKRYKAWSNFPLT